MGEILHFVFFLPKIMNTNYIALTLHIPFILNSYAIGARCSCVQCEEPIKRGVIVAKLLEGQKVIMVSDNPVVI